jgi:hypothetical protein
MAERVFLHVATPKSGTSYLQTVLWRNSAVLRRANLLLPGRFQLHYAAAKSVTNQAQMRQVTQKTDEVWPRLTRQINKWPGDALISHELFAPATVEQSKQAKAALTAAETHLILTARALHKQIPATWQQGVRGGLAQPFDRYLMSLRTGTGKASWFWSVQDLADIAERWGSDLPPERIHIVTVPVDASNPGELWRRYAPVLGIDPSSCDVDVPRRNPSVGAVEAELMRRVHARGDTRISEHRRFSPWSRRLLVGKVLAERSGAPFVPPDDAREWVSERTAAMVRRIQERGYHVVGDLAELDWQAPPPGARTIGSVTEAEIEDLCGWTIGRLQEELVHRLPAVPPPAVAPSDGIDGILELLEHIRAADTGAQPRPASTPSQSRRLIERVRQLVSVVR